MDLQNLKASWNNINYSPKNEMELEKMTAVKNHPVLKRIKTKLVVETLAISLFWMLYYSGFDGAEKPIFANVLLIFGAIAYILNGVLSFQAIQKPIQGDSLNNSIKNYFNKIKTISKISLGISIFYSSCLLLFFGSTISFNSEKKWILLFGIIVLIQAFFWSSRIWRSWLKKLAIQIKHLE